MDLSAYQQAVTHVLEITQNYESGDLMELLNIQESYEALSSLLMQSTQFKDLGRFVVALNKMSDKLRNFENEPAVLNLLQRANQKLKQLFYKEKQASEIAPQLNRILSQIQNFESFKQTFEEPLLPETSQSDFLSEDKSADPLFEQNPVTQGYSEDYFDHIMNDPQMLRQLVDEIKDHLDAAQYTLVDLENDPENEENINKVFRSFHTIKGSSAFLGLKNIEETGHIMESLLVLIRDGKFKITKDLTDVIFSGIEILRTISSVMEKQNFNIEKMKTDFLKIDIFTYITLLEKILSEYKTKSIGEIIGKNKISDPKPKISPQNTEPKIPRKTASYVKVSNERLNNLIDMVGELVINQSMLREIIQNPEKESDQTERVISQLETISTNMKTIVLSMGMVPIADVFNKLRVVIRNTSKEEGKSVTVKIQGEETELDRNVVETIYDPLVHLVRNAVDHGLETPDERKQTDKPPIGLISIAAEHKGNGIEIVISDDGKGIDKDRIIQKAIEKKLIDPGDTEKLSEKEIFNFLFQPGFSTAKTITEISGRGVGLDVVKNNIDSIHGKVEISSKKNSYTRFTIRLPLTLAIIEGFVTSIGTTKYIFPFAAIREIIVPEEKNITTLDDGNKLLFHRGSTIPLIFSGQVFQEPEFEKDLQKALILLIFFEDRFYGIVVDRVVGKQEIVIKNLGDSLSNLNVFSGGTIFGDGTIGFVVDIEGFLNYFDQ